MTRCKEFYDKWEREPNWCEKCQSAVSQIDSYLGLVRELEGEGIDRNITFAILPETVARGILTVKDRNKERTKKNLAAYLKSPNCTKIRVAQTHGFIQRHEPQPYKPPSYETKLWQNEKRIKELQSQIEDLEQENEQLRKNIACDAEPDAIVDFIKGIDRMLLQIHQGLDVIEHDGKVEHIKSVSVVGLDAAKAKLVKAAEVGQS